MNLRYRRIRLEDEKEVRVICEIDAVIPAMFDPDFPSDEKVVLDRISDLKKCFNDEDFLEVAVDQQERILGFHIVKQVEVFGRRVAQIYTLWVSPEFRNNGVAATLKQRAEVWAQDRGIGHIETWVHPRNSRMVDLNQKNGFEVVSLKMKKRL